MLSKEYEMRAKMDAELEQAASGQAAAAPMATARSTFGMAALGGKIYAAGGIVKDDDEAVSSTSAVEAYDPQSNTWSAVAPMGTARGAFGLAVMRGKLFTAGGSSNGNGVQATAEAYDPQHDRWEAAAPMASARYAHALVATSWQFEGHECIPCLCRG